MSEILEKLRPDRDLQCYFYRPSAVAALSATRSTGFTVSGAWRQQFDWAVVEWNRDNVFEHPLLRCLPDGDLSGLTLSYPETRTHCILMDSGLYPTVDWPYLRIWANDASGAEQIYRVRLKDYATPTAGSFTNAQATFTLQGTLTPGDYVELSWLDEHYYHVVRGSDTIADVLNDLKLNINTFSTTVAADVPAGGTQIVLTNTKPGLEGNYLGIAASVNGAQSEVWAPASQTMSGGASPTEWQVTLDFGALTDAFLKDANGQPLPIPTQNVRKMRWTYAAALQPGVFQRGEFSVAVTAWTVSGTNRAYQVAGPRSRRFEDVDPKIAYTGTWAEERGNYSGGTIHRTSGTGGQCRLDYWGHAQHRLYFGSRRTRGTGIITVRVDGQPEQVFDLYVPGEDFLVRLGLGDFAVGSHSVTATLTGADPNASGQDFYFDYFELAVAASTVNVQPAQGHEALATDWDTDHSLALAPERVAWNIQMLGFTGRANHYAGALLFYELVNPHNVYAQGTVTFQGTPGLGQVVEITISGTVYSRVTLITDTLETVAKAFEYLMNNGSTGVWAQASGAVLTVQARATGAAGNSLTLAATTTTNANGNMQAVASGDHFSGGADGAWLTELGAMPRLNRAARDWHRSYFAALNGYGIDATAAFSTELGNGDPSFAAGIAQRYPNGDPVMVSTPALQTNFSPASLAFWKQVYRDMAQIMNDAGQGPYLQFGEVQWWYFPGPSGMTFYDEYTTTTFQAQYGRAMHVFTSNDESPAPYPEEAAFLPSLIGDFTTQISEFVKAEYAQAKFEALYPPDVNDFGLTRVANLPGSPWGPDQLEVLKTENFTYTGARNLNKARASILLPLARGFPRNRMAHLVGVGNSSEPWDWERRLARGEYCETVVLFAFDQFSMIGYRLPLSPGSRRSEFMG
ncbi:MAG: hypothetical protein HY236_13700 [Acidobacteria bacterium]|nr:hypothetical protein [Acidobacteriota bacterium]